MKEYKLKETFLTDFEIILENLKLMGLNKTSDYLDCVIKCIKIDNNII